MIADLDTLLTALHVELTDRIIPSSGFGRSGPGRRTEVTDAELVCLAVQAAGMTRYAAAARKRRKGSPAHRGAGIPGNQGSNLGADPSDTGFGGR